MNETQIANLARRITEDLFKSPEAGRLLSRLVQEDKEGRLRGGWSQRSFENYIRGRITSILNLHEA